MFCNINAIICHTLIAGILESFDDLQRTYGLRCDICLAVIFQTNKDRYSASKRLTMMNHMFDANIMTNQLHILKN